MNQTKNFSGLVSLILAVLIGALPFAAPEACAQALREGLTLCSGPLLLSLYPFLVVSALLIQCPLGDVLALPFRPVAWLVGVYGLPARPGCCWWDSWAALPLPLTLLPRRCAPVR